MPEEREKHDRTIPALNEGDRSRIAKAICGLANADGGVFLFGVRARTDAGGIDRVQNIEPIADVVRCARHVEDTIARWIEPAISIVHIETSEDPGSGSGIVLGYVPASDGGPHRVALGAEQGRYYLRAGSRTEIMPHTILADRFGRRPQARLRLVADFISGTGSPTHHAWGISLRLVNQGRGVARQPAIVVRDPTPGLDWRSPSKTMQGWAVMYGHGNWRPNFCGWQGPSDAVVYPGGEQYVVHVGHGNASGGLTTLPFKGTIYALDAEPHDFDCVLTIDSGAVIL